MAIGGVSWLIGDRGIRRSLEFISAAIIIGPHAGACVRGRRVVDAGFAQDIVEWFAGSIRVGAVDRRRSGAGVVIAEDSEAVIRHPGLPEDRRDRIHKERIPFQPMHFLAAHSGLERRQRGVVGVIPDDLDRGVRAVEEVVIRGRPGCGVRVEAQVAAPGTGGRRGPVFGHDVVGDDRTEGTERRSIAFEVDPDRTVALDRVADDGVVGRLVVIDAVVAVLVAEVPDDQVVVEPPWPSQ